MNLPPPPGQYNADDQAECRRQEMAADKANMKLGQIFTKQIFKSPDGNKWIMSVSNAGATVSGKSLIVPSLIANRARNTGVASAARESCPRTRRRPASATTANEIRKDP